MDVDRTTVQPALAVVLVRRIVGAEMSNVADVFAVLAGCVLLFASVSESVLFKNQAVHQGISEVRTADLPPQRWWSFHLGIYSVFLGAAPIIGVIAEHTHHPHVARTLVLYGCACIFLGGVVLAFANRRASDKEKEAGMVAALAMCVPAIIAIVTELIAWLA